MPTYQLKLFNANGTPMPYAIPVATQPYTVAVGDLFQLGANRWQVTRVGHALIPQGGDVAYHTWIFLIVPPKDQNIPVWPEKWQKPDEWPWVPEKQ